MMSKKNDFHGRWIKTSIGVTLYISETIYVQVFKIYRLGWRWTLSGIHFPETEYGGGADTMRQAKIDAVATLLKAFDLMNGGLNDAQQNTPGFPGKGDDHETASN